MGKMVIRDRLVLQAHQEVLVKPDRKVKLVHLALLDHRGILDKWDIQAR
jgi:hypothetical protein